MGGGDFCQSEHSHQHTNPPPIDGERVALIREDFGSDVLRGPAQRIRSMS